MPNFSFSILLIAARNHKTLLKKVENIILNKQGIKMKKIRLLVYVLLCSLCVVNVEILNGADDCPTSPVNQAKENLQDTKIIEAHRTTPVDLSASLQRFPSCPSCNDLYQRALSKNFSTEDLAVLVVAHSPKRCPLSQLHVNEAHGTTPVKATFCNPPHATSPVGSGSKK